MNYDEALNWLFGQLPMFSRVGAAAYKPGLQTAENLDATFGHPHRRFKSIHIGGTNGKGSTSHMLASILQAQGYKVALYTSPHLVDFRERIRVNGRMIPREAVIDFVERWQQTPYEGHPSFFELTMMMAFDYFAKENVDYAVIEVGMGGRLDSTNIISPIATVITNISKDHTQFLGTTLPQIAAEKAGIIKPGIPVVIGNPGTSEVRQVFQQAADRAAIIPDFASDLPLPTNWLPLSQGGWQFDAPSPRPAQQYAPAQCAAQGAAYSKFQVPLGGDYQKENINTVLHTVAMLRKAGVEISDAAIVRGLADVIESTGLMGRWMHLSDHPLVIADTGHNIDGLRHNLAQLQSIRKPSSRIRFVIGFVADKAIDEILPLLPKDTWYYVTQAAIPRAMPADQLGDLFKKAGLPHEVIPQAPEAYRRALEATEADDILYVGGSTFVVADVLACLKTQAPKPGL